MSELTNKLIDATGDDNQHARRIARQLRHIENAIERTEDGPARDFLYASFQALNWARSPDDFAPPVQMID